MKRLLVALPIAAVIVVALFWAMRELVPVGRAKADYTVVIRRNDAPDCRHCYTIRIGSVPKQKLPPIVDGFDVPPPPPPPPPSKPVEPTEMPREKFPAPEVRPELSPRTEEGSCEPYPILRTAPIWPKHARHGDYAVVEFTVDADGIPRDIKVVESSNPKIHDDVVGAVRRWKYRPECMGGQTVRTRIEFRVEGMEE